MVIVPDWGQSHLPRVRFPRAASSARLQMVALGRRSPGSQLQGSNKWIFKWKEIILLSI